MTSLLFSMITAILYILCGLRIASFSHGGNFHRGLSFVAALLIAAFMAQGIHILFFKDPVTVIDFIVAIFVAAVIFNAKGNISKIIWSKSWS